MSDTSNRKSDKMLPVMIRGFDTEESVRTFKLSVKIIPNKKSETIRKKLLGTGKDWKLTEKIVGFCADNCVTNFGMINRNGNNNVFHRLKSELKREIVGIGCVAHIVHNAFDSVCSQIPFNIESLVVNIYKYFNIHSVRVEALKEFCERSEIEYVRPASHSGTRFLTLFPAIQKVKFSI